MQGDMKWLINNTQNRYTFCIKKKTVRNSHLVLTTFGNSQEKVSNIILNVSIGHQVYKEEITEDSPLVVFDFGDTFNSFLCFMTTNTIITSDLIIDSSDV